MKTKKSTEINYTEEFWSKFNNDHEAVEEFLQSTLTGKKISCSGRMWQESMEELKLNVIVESIELSWDDVDFGAGELPNVIVNDEISLERDSTITILSDDAAISIVTIPTFEIKIIDENIFKQSLEEEFGGISEKILEFLKKKSEIEIKN